MLEHTDKDRITEEDDEFDVLRLMNEYADRQIKFNTTFLDGVDNYYRKYGCLTRAQVNGLIDLYNNTAAKEKVHE